MTNPVDDLTVQLPGRLLALEMLVSLLLRRKGGLSKLLIEADQMLGQIEVARHAEADDPDGDRVTTMFAIARESLDKIGATARR